MQQRLMGMFAFAAVCLSSAAQTASNPKPASRAVPLALKPWTACKFPGGPDLLQTTPLPQAPLTRTAQTLTGPKQIKIADGLLAAFGYPNSAPFTNVKIEMLPAASYGAEKTTLIGEFDAINAKGEDTQRNYGLKPTVNGFEIYGFDRTALDGKVLGIYLFFDNARHVATTAYFLNAPEGQRRFNSVQEYGNLREGFLDAYTLCVRKELGGGNARTNPATKAAPKKVSKRKKKATR